MHVYVRAVPGQPELGECQLARVLRRLWQRQVRSHHRRRQRAAHLGRGRIGHNDRGARASRDPRRTDHHRCRCRRPRRCDSRSGRAHRHQHAGELAGAHRDVVSRGAGAVARGQPFDPEQLPAAHAWRQGQLHSHHRLRRRARDRRCAAGDELVIPHRRVGPTARRPPRPRQPRHRSRCREGRPFALTHRAVHQRRRHARLPRIRRRVRRAHPQGSLEQDHTRRHGGHDRFVDQPRHVGHGAVGAPAHARSRCHCGCRHDRLPDRLPGRRPCRPRRYGHLQDRHADFHL